MVDQNLICEECKHSECKADPATKLCVFCEDGKACPVKVQEMRAHLQAPPPAKITTGTARPRAFKEKPAPAPPKEKEATVPDRRTCNAPAHGIPCTKKLIASNKSGYCTEHWRLSQTGNREKAEARSTARGPASGWTRRGKALKKARQARAQERIAAPTKKKARYVAFESKDGDQLLLRVTEPMLDDYWKQRTPTEKLDIVQKHMTAAAGAGSSN